VPSEQRRRSLAKRTGLNLKAERIDPRIAVKRQPSRKVAPQLGERTSAASCSAPWNGQRASSVASARISRL